MTHSFDTKLQNTRRALLQATPCTLGVVSFLAMSVLSAKAAAKISKSAVGYQNMAAGSQRCSNCRVFVPPGACVQVEGSISPKASCKLWEPKG